MSSRTAIPELHDLRRSFGKGPARAKLLLLREIERAPRLSARDLLRLQGTLDFLRAYPDDPALLEQAHRVRDRIREWVAELPDGAETPSIRNSGLPGSVTSHPFSLDVVRCLDRSFPGCLEVDWEELQADAVLSIVIELLLTGAENEGMEDLAGYWPDWIERSHGVRPRSDLRFLLELLEGSTFDGRQRECLFEACGLPIRYELGRPGTGRCEVALPPAEVCYQTREFTRETFPLRPEIERPLTSIRPVTPARGRALLDLAFAALCSRGLEILPLTGSNPADVHLFAGERGLQVLLAGVVPEQRTPLASLFLFLVLKNGVPIAYGPAVLFLGCCEMGINLFPEFRGCEIRTVYARVMQALHHTLGADFFFLTRYGMGVDNEEALASGAFWFYRKLGFAPSNSAVEAIAQEEERRMKAEPGYRSDRRTLRRLSDTEAWFDLSGGRSRRFDFAALSLATSRYLNDEHGSARERAVQRCQARVERALGAGATAGWTPAERAALRDLSPILAMLPELPHWSRADKAAMVRIVRGKAARSEINAARRMRGHPRFERELRGLLE